MGQGKNKTSARSLWDDEEGSYRYFGGYFQASQA